MLKLMSNKTMDDMRLRHYGDTILPQKFGVCLPPNFTYKQSWYKPACGVWFVPYKPFEFDPWFLWCHNHPEDGKTADPLNRVDTKFNRNYPAQILEVNDNKNYEWLVDNFPLPWFKFHADMNAYLPYVNWYRVSLVYRLDGIFYTKNFVKNTPYGWSIDVESLVLFNRKVVI